MYVVATAGHVDHGKSTLVRALTGMEPDRWAEERRRGMTIDLGYAWMTLPAGDSAAEGRAQEGRAPEDNGPAGEMLAFVDVPGHERFVPNMLAGLGPVPAVMFVVAADGGWMPQSAEHLAAVDALGVRHGLLVITRSDLADPGPATRQARAEIARTSLGAVEAVPVSAVTGQGLDQLNEALVRLVGSLHSTHAGSAPVRLWIDRSFTIRGAGTVVTGTLPAGTVRNGQELVLAPSGRTVRVRGLEALGEPADEVSGVARVALNLRGIPADIPARGMALIEPGRWTLTSELDIRLTPPADDPHPRFPPDLLVHIGSARTQARVRLLGPDPVYARLRLKEPLPLHVGDRLILRDPGAAGLAIYGATVLDPFPPPLARRGAGAAAARELGAWPETPTAADLLRRHKLLRGAQLAAAGVAVSHAPGEPGPVAGDWLADPEHWAWLRAELPRAVAAFCAKDPLAPGMPAEAARAALDLPSRDLVAALAAGEVVLDGAYLRIFTRQAGQPDGSAPPGAGSRPAQAGQLPPGIADAVREVLDGLAGDPFAAPDTDRLRALGLDARALAAAARVGLLLRVADLIVLAPGADKAAAGVLAGLDQPFTTSQARQALRTSRRVAIPLLEYLDRARVTERLPGDLRRIRVLPGGPGGYRRGGGPDSTAITLSYQGVMPCNESGSGVRVIRARLTVRRGARTVLTAATGAVAFAALTAACSSSASSGSAPAPTGTGASQSSAAGAPSGAAASAGTSKLSGAAATALVTKAIANTQAAASVRVAGSATATGSATGGSGSQPVTFDLTLVKNVGCQGTLALSKTETFQLVETGGYVWILPSSAYYQSLHLDKAALALMADKYIKVKSTDKQIGDLGQECTFSGLLGSLSKPAGKDYTAVPVTYNGGPAYEVTQSGQQGTAFVANTATPLLLKITDPQKDGGTITFTSYNATKTITAPTAAESIDGSQLGI